MKYNTKIKSKKQESKVAKEMNAKVVVASGALWHSKADVKTDDFLIECKTTANPYYILTVKTWKKIQEEALRDSMRTPLMQIQLEDGETEVAVLNIHDFLGLELDVDTTFTGGKEPLLLDAMSYRVNGDFINDALITNTSNIDSSTKICYYRQDIKFVDHNLHLVILEWNDFIKLINRGN